MMRLAISTLVFGLGAFGLASCSSDSDTDGSQGNNGTGGTGPQINLTGGNTGSTLDGGSVELTPAEIDNITGAACAGWTTEGENLPAVLQLVVDVSGSMDQDAPGSDDSKWQITRDALETAIVNLPDSTSVGVLYYPNQGTGGSTSPRDVDECVNVQEMVPIGGLVQAHRDALLQSLEDANTGSLTPTHDAYRYALQNGLVPYQTQANKFMLLITDGAPTMALECIGESGRGQIMDAPTQPIIDEIAGAFALGIRTFLIGSPGSEESSQSDADMRPWLSQAAIEGGTDQPGCQAGGPDFCHLDMTQEADFSAALNAGLSAVLGKIIDSCTFTVPPAPAGMQLDTTATNLIITYGDGNSWLILPDAVGDCTEGWRFNNAGAIELCSATCDRVQADNQARAQLVFGCRTEDVVPVR